MLAHGRNDPVQHGTKIAAAVNQPSDLCEAGESAHIGGWRSPL
jgi:hypothetical protein